MMFLQGSKRFFRNLKELLAGHVVPIAKNEYGSLIHFLYTYKFS